MWWSALQIKKTGILPMFTFLSDVSHCFCILLWLYSRDSCVPHTATAVVPLRKSCENWSLMSTTHTSPTVWTLSCSGPMRAPGLQLLPSHKASAQPLMRSLLHGADSIFFMYPLKGPVDVCVCVCVCVCVFYMDSNRSRITGYEKSGW